MSARPSGAQDEVGRSSPLAPSSSASASPSPARTPPAEPQPSLRWSRRISPIRRISASTRRSRSSESTIQRLWTLYLDWSHWAVQTYVALPPTYKVLAAIAGVAAFAAVVLMIVYSHRFLIWLVGVTKSWRHMPGGWLIVFALIFVTAFPPLIGYSTANTIAGIVYGFPLGWPIVAVGCTVGSLCAFLASRTVLSRYVDRMVGKDHRFVALGQVLRKDGLVYLTAIRFCPLPFSLSNGFLATIPSISPLAFAISTALSTPKLLVHVFVGSRLAILAEEGDSMTARDKAINYIAMFLGGLLGLVVGLAIYRRTMARAAELAREDGRVNGLERGQAGYDDELLDPEDAAAVMADDDVSLWDGAGNNEWAMYNDDEDTGAPRTHS